MGYSFILLVTQKRKPVLMWDTYRRQILEVPELVSSISGKQNIRYGFLSMSYPPVVEKKKQEQVKLCQ